MKLIDVLLLAAVAAAVFFALRRMRRGPRCNCGCHGCDGRGCDGVSGNKPRSR